MNRANNSWRFRLYPENKSLYFLAWIHKNEKDVLAHARRSLKALGGSKREIGKTLRACVIPLAICRMKRHPLAGDIVFCRKDLGVSVTAHKIAHAALAWARRIRPDFPKDEKRFCEAECYDWNIYK